MNDLPFRFCVLHYPRGAAYSARNAEIGPDEWQTADSREELELKLAARGFAIDEEVRRWSAPWNVAVQYRLEELT